MTAHHHNNKATKTASGLSSSSSSVASSIRRHQLTTRRRAATIMLTNLSSIAAAAAAATVIKPTVRIALPGSLPRPAFLPVPEAPLRKACPELSSAPLSYVREGLKLLSTHMLAGAQSAIPLFNKSQLPNELPVLLSDPISHGSICPTHVLAVMPCTTPAPSPTHKAKLKVALYAVHHIVLGSACASLPHFPDSAAAGPLPPTDSNRVVLPVVRLAVPAPAHFPALLTYLYTQDPEILLRTLLPANWDTDANRVLQRAGCVRGVWSNAVVLRVADPALYNVIDHAWQLILRQLGHLTSSPSL